MPKESASGLWRSEDMVSVDLVIQREAVHDTVYYLGMMGKSQFVDANSHATAFQRPFTNEIRRCDDLERKLRVIADELQRENINDETMQTLQLAREAQERVFKDDVASVLTPRQLEETEEHVDTLLTELTALNGSVEGMQREINHHLELVELYERLLKMVSSAYDTQTSQDRSRQGSLSAVASGSSNPFATMTRISNIVGTVSTDKSEMLYRLAFRTTRGNAIVELSNETQTMVDPKTGEVGVPRVSFAIFCSASTAIARLRKLLTGVGATIYTMDDVIQQADEARNASQQNSSGTIAQLKQTLTQTKQRKLEALRQYYPYHQRNMRFVHTEKAILSTMNLLTYTGSTCSATLWTPAHSMTQLEEALHEGIRSSSGDVQSVVSLSRVQKNPPTFFPTNRFTESFQGIVDSYGMARYKEVNPGVFTIITFPYLFGVMYGDIGHGVLLTLIAIFLIAMERSWSGKQLNEIVAMIYGGRYLLLLMGIFAIYMGVLYNDFFGFSVGIFPSGYQWPSMETDDGSGSGSTNSSGEYVVYPSEPNGLPRVRPNNTYVFGLDVAWAETENKLEYYNSVKMKCAVIIGVVQMLIGVLLSLLNHIHERNFRKIIFLFIPEFTFLMATFGYMSILIVVKWCSRWDNTNDAPSVLETMTNFFLAPGSVPMPLYSGQATVQVILLLLAFAMAPVMLLGMPITDYLVHTRKQKDRLRASTLSTVTPSPPVNRSSGAGNGVGSHTTTSDSIQYSKPGSRDQSYTMFSATGDASAPSIIPDNVYINSDGEEEEEEAFEVGEVVIHYVIHTIEYILGCVSNTASYLRLWALSLAHAQLSEVFLTFAFVKVLSMDTSGAATAFGVLIWLNATMGVLVGMEALSAFLHALRLHWVEFNGKFYKGDGMAFVPLNLIASAKVQ